MPPPLCLGKLPNLRRWSVSQSQVNTNLHAHMHNVQLCIAHSKGIKSFTFYNPIWMRRCIFDRGTNECTAVRGVNRLAALNIATLKRTKPPFKRKGKLLFEKGTAQHKIKNTPYIELMAQGLWLVNNFGTFPLRGFARDIV